MTSQRVAEYVDVSAQAFSMFSMEPLPESPSCDCETGNHEHGTRPMYNYHRCRCAPCKNANNDYHRRAKKYRPRREMVDADLVRARIQQLRTAGVTVAEMADMCAVNINVIHFAIRGRRGRKPRTVQASTLTALNAIRHKDVAAVVRPRGRRVNGDIPRRQIQSLQSLGWSSHEIATRAGVTTDTVNRVLKGHMTTENLRGSIDSLNRDLRLIQPPLGTPEERYRAMRAKRRAAANGWTAYSAEDQD